MTNLFLEALQSTLNQECKTFDVSRLADAFGTTTRKLTDYTWSKGWLPLCSHSSSLTGSDVFFLASLLATSAVQYPNKKAVLALLKQDLYIAEFESVLSDDGENSLGKRIGIQTNKRIRLSATVDTLVEQMAETKAELTTVKERADLTEAELGETKAELTTVKERADLTEAELTTVKERADLTEAELGETRAELGETRAELTTVKERADLTEAELGETKAELTTVKERADLTEAELTTVKERADLTEAELGETRAELGETRAELTTVKERADLTEAELGETKAELGETKAELGETKAELGLLSSQCAMLSNEYKELEQLTEAKVTKLGAELGETKAELCELKQIMIGFAHTVHNKIVLPMYSLYTTTISPALPKNVRNTTSPIMAQLYGLSQGLLEGITKQLG